jgi:hypothetical protein
MEYDGDLLIHPEDAKKCLNIDGEFIAYSEKSSSNAVYVKTNFVGNVISFSRDGGDFEWTGPVCIKKEKLKFSSGHVYNQLEGHLPMKGINIRACDIDTYEDYLHAQEFIKSWK